MSEEFWKEMSALLSMVVLAVMQAITLYAIRKIRDLQKQETKVRAANQCEAVRAHESLNNTLNTVSGQVAQVHVAAVEIKKEIAASSPGVQPNGGVGNV